MRKNGVLMHISSLPSKYGIGTLGKAAYEFVDFLDKALQSYWQILPIGPTGYGDSPYQSYSAYAGNPYFVDLDLLSEIGLLNKDDIEVVKWEEEGGIDYGNLYKNRYPILKKASERFFLSYNESFSEFEAENSFWLEDYALFMTIKDIFEGKSWLEWDDKAKNREEEYISKITKEYKKDILFWKFIQFIFFTQWNNLKEYANDKGIEIIGDIPIYVSLDSVDVWANPELFYLDENKVPIRVAGCPPDGFSATGQLWGNPLFEWETMEKNGFLWWLNRISYLSNIYDTIRIDHFRGFDSYYAIPFGDNDAKRGIWLKGPGMKLFNRIREVLGERNIIAEDLGFLTESVRQLLEDSGFPGMKVLELGFDSRDPEGEAYLPHNFIKKCVAYAGTHDNDTIAGWFSTAPEDDIEYAKEYFYIKDMKDISWDIMSALWASVADTTIVQAQDLLGLSSESRMNTPSTLGKNWCFRVKKGELSDELADKLAKKMKLYRRDRNK